MTEVQEHDVVRQILGNGGPWQYRGTFLIYLTKIPAAWFMACVIFTAPTPRFGEYYCAPTDLNITIRGHEVKEWISVANPVKVDYHRSSIDICSIYRNAEERFERLRNGTLDVQASDNATRKCDNFVFRMPHVTKVAAFSLVCDRNILISVTQTFHLLGVLIGAVLATRLLKTFDPKTVMLLGMVLQIMFGVLSGEVNFFHHCWLRAADSACTGLMYVSGAMIFSDITGGPVKVAAATMFESFWAVGVMLLALIGMGFHNWNSIYFAISVPTVLLIFLLRWVPNSPQWFLKRGRIQEAKQILTEAASSNSRADLVTKDIDLQLEQTAKGLQGEPPPAKWREIWENRRTAINLICVHLLQASAISVHFATLLNVGVYGRDYLYVNCVIAGVFEVVGTVLGYLLIRYSSKYKWQWGALVNFTGGLSILFNWAYVFDEENEAEKLLSVLSSMLTKAAASCSLAIMAGSTSELVTGNRKPTATYSVLVFSRVAFLLAPYIGGSWYFLGRMGPISIMGGLSMLNAVLSLIIFPHRESQSSTV